MEDGSSFRRFSRSSSDSREVSRPKSAGSDVSDMSFRPRVRSDLSWLKAGGNRGIGFELKSATCKARKWPMLSGMSGMSKTNYIIG